MMAQFDEKNPSNNNSNLMNKEVCERTAIKQTDL